MLLTYGSASTSALTLVPSASISSSEVPVMELDTCITKCPSRKSGMKVPPRNGSAPAAAIASPISTRSEEHTSELQSQFHLVCRLLLEKKNKYLYESLRRRGVSIDLGQT